MAVEDKEHLGGGDAGLIRELTFCLSDVEVRGVGPVPARRAGGNPALAFTMLAVVPEKI